jgi:hypothetical protein
MMEIERKNAWEIRELFSPLYGFSTLFQYRVTHSVLGIKLNLLRSALRMHRLKEKYFLGVEI